MQGNNVTGFTPPLGSSLRRQDYVPLAPREAPSAPAPPAGRQMTEERLKKANDLLKRYQSAKSAHDARVVENEKWYRQRHWEIINSKNREPDDEGELYETKSAWLFNALNILHSDAMDAFPRLNVLPREEGDKEEAERLSSILPVVLEQNDFRETYDANTWRKGRSGTGVYGIYWDAEKLNGLGDISIVPVDVLNLFWEHGRNDIQKSANVFHVEMIDRDELKQRYSDLDDQALGGNDKTVREYQGEDSERGDNRVAVIDWYYKRWQDGRRVLHYCKYVNTTVIYATEDDHNAPEGQEPPSVRGLYDHGEYPFVFDAFYPIEGSCAGFGLIDVNKSAQQDIDLLKSAIVTNAAMHAYPRYVERSDGGINERDLMNWRKPLLKVEGSASIADNLMPLVVPELPAVSVQVMNNTIEELKQTSGSTDVANGTSTSGVTAYSALAALIETAGKNTKAFSAGSYRAFRRIGLQVIELIRQFYDMPRQFRIIGADGQMRFVDYSNERLQRQAMGADLGGEMMYRKPLFDLKISAEKETTYTRLAQNEMAKEMLGMGVFNPQTVDQSLLMLDMMDFDGKEGLMEKLREMGTMAQKLAYFEQIALELAQRFDPAMAEQLANEIMLEAQGTAPRRVSAGGQEERPRVQTDPVTGAQRQEHANGAKARGRVDEATRPT